MTDERRSDELQCNFQMQQPSLFKRDEVKGADATFERVKEQPIYSWFPYLEGYSAAFVEGLQTRFLPHARRIIDPFAGTGTTALALSMRGIECGYCEANPVMRHVIATKVRVLTLNAAAKARLTAQLEQAATTLKRDLAMAKPDVSLPSTYAACFGDSIFFDPATFDHVCRLRTHADNLAALDPLLGDLFSIAIIANLVACSRLKRAGDVRYKTEKELQRGIPNLLATVMAQLWRIASDVKHSLNGECNARLLAEDAKDLSAIPTFDADGVITSPPYLNGTNYIRNTKLELWFLRQITAAADLRRLRDAMVTAGINDVAGSQAIDSLPQVAEVVRNISADAYDQRIPQMVAAYFADMERVLTGLWSHCKRHAVVCIDIGDSRYGGVHVPTHSLLVDVATSVGFECIERVPLRKRLSKDRTPLSQEVVVLKRTSKPTRTRARARNESQAMRRRNWEWFKTTLPHQNLPYTKRNWGHPLHSACSYQGKMKPSLAHFLVHCFSEAGQTVLDPFSGAGTIPFEAALQGRRAIGFDIGVMGFAVTSAKLSPPDPERLESFIEGLDKVVRKSHPTQTELRLCANVKFNRPIPEYFHPDTLSEVLCARKFMAEHRDRSPEWAWTMTCLLHILHGNRPYALSRRSHPVTPFAPTGPTEYRSVVHKLRQKSERGMSAERPAQFLPGNSVLADVLERWPSEVSKVDAIITSPPFFDSTRFYMSNWMRYWFCGWEREDFDSEPSRFVESLQRLNLDVYSRVFKRFREHLSESGVVVMHLGHSRKCNMAMELARRAEPLFSVAEVFSEDVTHCEKHGVRDKGTVTAHQYLILTPR
ncbi:MAG: DNA methyltransferase [Vicinamibacterales bacterium]